MENALTDLEALLYGGLTLFALLGFLYLFVRYAAWAMEDAEKRGKSPIIVMIAVTWLFPYGLIAWLLFRPNPERNWR